MLLHVSVSQTPSSSELGPAVVQVCPAVAPTSHDVGGSTSANARGAATTTARVRGAARRDRSKRRRTISHLMEESASRPRRLGWTPAAVPASDGVLAGTPDI